MESPGKTILRYFPGLSLSGSDLTILVNCQKTLKRVKQHITAIYCTVQCGINGLGIGTDLNGKLFAFGTSVTASELPASVLDAALPVAEEPLSLLPQAAREPTSIAAVSSIANFFFIKSSSSFFSYNSTMLCIILY